MVLFGLLKASEKGQNERISRGVFFHLRAVFRASGMFKRVKIRQLRSPKAAEGSAGGVRGGGGAPPGCKTCGADQARFVKGPLCAQRTYL
jgi:hypothetical protein